MNKQKIIDEYSVPYCSGLELAYGEGMMSEGGGEAIEHMFSDFNVVNKKMLDIGFGLGGVAIYLARKYHAEISGIEINPWMVNEANQRVSPELNDLIRFYHYEDKVPFEESVFDIVYSKGVLCHLEDKQFLFNEIFRVLKHNGKLIINDWLSSIKNQWSGRMQEMCELEDLTLFAETEDGYRAELSNANFSNINFRNDNQLYVAYNRDIVRRLEQSDHGRIFIEKHNKAELLDSIKGYKLIAEAIENKELLIRNITAEKI